MRSSPHDREGRGEFRAVYPLSNLTSLNLIFFTLYTPYTWKTAGMDGSLAMLWMNRNHKFRISDQPKYTFKTKHFVFLEVQLNTLRFKV
jgi:hypothetical protein